MGVSLIQNRVTPAADTVTDLVVIPANRALTPPVIQVQNQGDDDAQYQVFLAMAGATHAAKQSTCPKTAIPAGAVLNYIMPLSANARDVIRVWTDATANKVVFTISQPATALR